MSERHEREHKPREWVCSNGTIVTEYGPGAGVLAGRLHLESTAGETVLVPAAELQFLSDYDQERQPAEVTAETDEEECTECGYTHPADEQCDECPRCHGTVQIDDGLEMPGHRMCHPCATAALDDVLAERDALKRRVEELEQKHQKVTSIGVVHALRDALEALGAEWKTGDDVFALVLRVRDAAKAAGRGR